jgi:hypothetical protein
MALWAAATTRGPQASSDRPHPLSLRSGLRLRLVELLAAAHAGRGDALNERLLREEEEHDDGQHEQRRSSHQKVRLAAAILRLVLLKPERHRERLGLAQEDEGAEEVVPHEQKVKQGHDRQRRPG